MLRLRAGEYFQLRIERGAASRLEHRLEKIRERLTRAGPIPRLELRQPVQITGTVSAEEDVVGGPNLVVSDTSQAKAHVVVDSAEKIEDAGLHSGEPLLASKLAPVIVE